MNIFNPNTPILFLSRNKVIIGVVGSGKELSWRQLFELNIDFAGDTTQLESLIGQARDQLGDRNWHILIADELSYVFEIVVPKEINYTREYVADHVMSEVPDEFRDTDWDFKQTGLDTDGNPIVLIFAPVQAPWQVIRTIMKKLKIEVVAVEGEALAKARNTDPFLGLAMKPDLYGKDKEVLNLSGDRNWLKQNQPLILTVVLLLTGLIIVVLAIILLY